jgi:hydrogenase maturation protein HypF
MRRARGYAPLPIQTSSSGEPILSVGAHQKNTVALASNGQVFISQHIGDLVTRQALEAFDRTTSDLPGLYEASPRVVACDVHPDYLSTKHAEAMGCEVVRVQHHHAHIASCMAENDLSGTVLGVSWDGTGLGPDGTIWGGEFLRCDYLDFERVAHLRPVPLPGGEIVSREPRRSALGLLYEIYGEAVFDRCDLSPIAAFDNSERRVLRSLLSKRVNCPSTSSMGRLFDAVASILDIRQRVHYEGQGAMELEFAAAESETRDTYPFSLLRAAIQSADSHGASDDAHTPAVIDWQEMITGLSDDVHRGVARATVARKFHNTLVEMIVAVAERFDAERVVLSGGCFQNQLLLDRAITQLEADGFRPYWHQRVPPNDGGISLGQAVVAQHRIKESRSCA